MRQHGRFPQGLSVSHGVVRCHPKRCRYPRKERGQSNERMIAELVRDHRCGLSLAKQPDEAKESPRCRAAPGQSLYVRDAGVGVVERSIIFRLKDDGVSVFRKVLDEAEHAYLQSAVLQIPYDVHQSRPGIRGGVNHSPVRFPRPVTRPA
jgi:hypothetical protein